MRISVLSLLHNRKPEEEHLLFTVELQPDDEREHEWLVKKVGSHCVGVIRLDGQRIFLTVKDVNGAKRGRVRERAS